MKPWTRREVVFTCSNGWTIEKVEEVDFHMEGYLMAHCLGYSCAGPTPDVFSLREPDGTPRVTIYGKRHMMVGRANTTPEEEHQALVREHWPEAPAQHPVQFQLDYRRPANEPAKERLGL